MTKAADDIQFLEVSPDNVAEAGIYCIRDKKSPGYAAKLQWFRQEMNRGLKIFIAADAAGKQLGFIECLPAAQAWRPIQAEAYLFIQCIALFAKDAREKQIGSRLLALAEKEARLMNLKGLCAMSSKGPWMANKSLFEKNGFEIADTRGRFELMFKAFKAKEKAPGFINWEEELKKYKGWHLVYSDQCPWHHKSVTDLKEAAEKHGIKLQVKQLKTPAEAQKAPSGFGTYSLIKDGQLLEDHYLSKTRFENILKQQLKK